MALQTVVDTATLASLVDSLSRLTVALQAQLAGQAAPSSGPANVPPVAGPSTASTTALPAAGNTSASTSTGLHPDEVAHRLSTITASNWYVVTRGLNPGIYTTVFEANSNVLGVSGATQLKVGSKAEAIGIYRRAWESGNVQII